MIHDAEVFFLSSPIVADTNCSLDEERAQARSSVARFSVINDTRSDGWL